MMRFSGATARPSNVSQSLGGHAYPTPEFVFYVRISQSGRVRPIHHFLRTRPLARRIEGRLNSSARLFRQDHRFEATGRRRFAWRCEDPRADRRYPRGKESRHEKQPERHGSPSASTVGRDPTEKSSGYCETNNVDKTVWAESLDVHSLRKTSFQISSRAMPPRSDV